MKSAALMALGLTLLALPAGAQSNCLQIGRIYNWRALDRRTLIVEDLLHQKFKVGLQGFCPALPTKLSLGFQSNGGITGLACLRRGDFVISRDIAGRYRCSVMSVTPYTLEMEKADQAAAGGGQQ